MASKGKSKTPKIDPAYQAAVEAERDLVQQQLTDGERAELSRLAPETAFVMAPTTVCNEHVSNKEKPLECAKCGKPFAEWWTSAPDEARQSDQRLGSALDDFFEAEGIKDEVRARAAAKLFATDDGTVPLDEPTDATVYPGMVEVDNVWLGRAVKMAKVEGVTVNGFIVGLIKRQWIASGAGKGKR